MQWDADGGNIEQRDNLELVFMEVLTGKVLMLIDPNFKIDFCAFFLAGYLFY